MGESECLQPMERSAVSRPSEGSLAAPAPPSKGKKVAVQVVSSEGHDFMIDVEESSTVFNLKESIDEEIGVGTSWQEIFMVGYPLTDDDALLKDFTKFCNTFTVVVPAQGQDKDLAFAKPKPKQVISYREVFLITGERQNFQAIHLNANSKVPIKLKSKRFGVVNHIEGKDQIGKRIFHFQVYEVKREGSICLRHEDGGEKVYLVAEEGQNGEELLPVDTKTYDESTKNSSFDKGCKLSNTVSSWFGAIGSLLTGGVGLA